MIFENYSFKLGKTSNITMISLKITEITMGQIKITKITMN
jgi:hypothetical protein